MGAGFLVTAGIVRRETFVVLGCRALASLDTDVRFEVADEIRFLGLRGGPRTRGDFPGALGGSPLEGGVGRVDERQGRDRSVERGGLQVIRLRLAESFELIETGGPVVMEESRRRRIGSARRPVEGLERLRRTPGAEPGKACEIERSALPWRLGGGGGQLVGALVIVRRKRRFGGLQGVGCRRGRRREREDRDHRRCRSEGGPMLPGGGRGPP